MKFFISKQFKFNINISKHIKLPHLALSLLAIFSLAFLPTLSIVQQTHAQNDISEQIQSGKLIVQQTDLFQECKDEDKITIRPNTNASTSVELANINTYSLANIHGDIFATTDYSGALRNKTMTGAYGEKLSLPTGAALTSALANPNSLASKLTVSYVSGANTNIVTNGTNHNTVSEATNGYVGQHQKLTESNLTIGLIQMGARVYLPTIGRFLQVDPVEGGTDNNYVYVVDPVNSFDLNGEWGYSNVKKWSHDHWKDVAKGAIYIASTVATAVCIASVGCGVIGVFAIGAISNISTAAIDNPKSLKSPKQLVYNGIKGGVTNIIFSASGLKGAKGITEISAKLLARKAGVAALKYTTRAIITQQALPRAKNYSLSKIKEIKNDVSQLINRWPLLKRKYSWR